MTDNLPLKLLVAGIVGAVVGAAAADRFHPSGLLYGPFNSRPSTYRPRLPIDPTMGSGNVDRYGAADDRPEVGWRQPPPPEWVWRPPRYRPPAKPPARSAWCWEEYDEWDFGHYVRCTPRRRPWLVTVR
jgi:hypothetical protein